MDSTSVESASVAVSIIAAAMSAVSAVVVAWQAVQTWQSTRATIEAVDVAHAELSQGVTLRDDALKVHHITLDEYVLPRDALKLLETRGTVSVFNDGPRVMGARYRCGVDPSPRHRKLFVPPGQSRTVKVSQTETLRRWVGSHSNRPGATRAFGGPHGSTVRAKITCHLQFWHRNRSNVTISEVVPVTT